mmetsp:Transcript_23808/g.36215  ORF Transcript_23808/g.36215 Transcript_23808/m.36215 type:complete len:389 (+) Transcript_23808:123-1289(+)|eukprot:CAMPEP_0194082146 /NCGR_PEP_ID=MMETSP0149-20130528/7743_1 /TAXON_ID=122233 /ORGANISM="Chaetoceros debilis, Strain MM31A-1" /LENGTH=388 /DNA_ID=CAMNT_0038764229 /DNA_START=82 /DNA_END=1245 /DNA_ORIENTATION=+
MIVSLNAIMFALLAFVACTVTVAYAQALSNATSDYSSLEPIDGNYNLEVPWPGDSWFRRMGEDVKNTFSLNGQEHTSAYDAILHSGSTIVNPVKNFNCYINSFVIPHDISIQMVKSFGNFWGHHAICYLRNFFAGCIVYYGTAGFFHYQCYIHPRSKQIFEDRPRPSRAIIMDQIKQAQASLFVYVLLPAVSEFVIEEGYTKCYYTLEEVGGLFPYFFYTVVYFALVEIGIYWMHRTLHTNKFLYKHIHMPHHAYSRPETLTPWASIAFHPIDGMLQACPYVLCLPIIPCHYLTHTAMIFATAVWATYIHDSMDWNIDPIMGSKYHTVHHTHYIYNYGQIFTFCDRIWGTLRVPVGKTGVLKGEKKVKLLPAAKGLFGSGRGGKAKLI